jgi:hypothetical protein
MDYTFNRFSFSMRQIANMHWNLEGGADLIPRPYVINNLCDKQDGIIHIPSGQVVEWDKNDIVSQDINVYGKLIIKCTIRMANATRIIVHPNGKLLVDGGTITSLCVGDLWRGCSVYGGNNDYDVKFTNGAVIENTSAAVVSMFAPVPWPQITQYGNGILHADNTTFNNVRRIAEFISYSPQINSSYIRNCVQNGGHWSVTNWNCQNIAIEDNVFNNITKDCIVSSNGHFVITGNEFNSTENDILINDVTSNISMEIRNNKFRGDYYGLNTKGAPFSEHNVKRNIFENQFLGVNYDGHSQYHLEENLISSPIGSAFFDTGGGVCDLKSNFFWGNFVGTLPDGNNPTFNFFNNCYSTSFVDNFIIGQIGNFIYGDDDGQLGPANNCFTHGGNAASPVQDLGGTPLPFTYIEPSDNVVDCRDAVKAHPNVNIDNSGISVKPECEPPGFGPGGGGTTGWSYCHPNPRDKEQVITSYIWLLNRINQIQNDSNLSTQMRERLLHLFRLCLKRVRGYLFEIYLSEEKYQDARELFDGDSSEDAVVFVFSSYIMENNLQAAQQYLNSIVSNSIELSDFIAVQNINLMRLPYGPLYEATNAQINLVRSIALKSHVYAGYAKALYYELTGEVINSEIPELIRDQMTPRSTKERDVFKEIKIFPNPASDVLNIYIEGYKEVHVQIFDTFGKLINASKTGESNLMIPTGAWNQGMYIVRISSEGEVVKTEKIFIIH